MTTKFMKGEDGRDYVVTSETDLANKVTKISEGYIEIDAEGLDLSEDRLCVKLVKPEPLSVVGMKEPILKGSK